MVPQIILVLLCSNAVFGQIFEKKQNAWPGEESNIVPSVDLYPGRQGSADLPCSRRALEGPPESLNSLPNNEILEEKENPELYNLNPEAPISVSEYVYDIEYKDNNLKAAETSNKQGEEPEDNNLKSTKASNKQVEEPEDYNLKSTETSNKQGEEPEDYNLKSTETSNKQGEEPEDYNLKYTETSNKQGEEPEDYNLKYTDPLNKQGEEQEDLKNNNKPTKCDGKKETKVEPKSKPNVAPLKLSNRRNWNNRDLPNNVLPSDYQIEPPLELSRRNAGPLQHALLKATKSASKSPENKPESSDCPYKITPKPTIYEKEPVELFHRGTRRSAGFLENKAGLDNDTGSANDESLKTKVSLPDNARVCYACSTANNPTCLSPNRSTTVKYCRKGHDACVTKTFKLIAGTVMTRDCGTSCQDSTQSFMHPMHTKCTVCHTDLCNGAYSVTAQNMLFIFCMALVSTYKLGVTF